MNSPVRPPENLAGSRTKKILMVSQKKKKRYL
jgi:hypothetical protein